MFLSKVYFGNYWQFIIKNVTDEIQFSLSRWTDMDGLPSSKVAKWSKFGYVSFTCWNVTIHNNIHLVIHDRNHFNGSFVVTSVDFVGIVLHIELVCAMGEHFMGVFLWHVFLDQDIFRKNYTNQNYYEMILAQKAFFFPSIFHRFLIFVIWYKL